jgi:hypothetical protein
MGLAESEEIVGVDHRIALLATWPICPAPLPLGGRLGRSRAVEHPAPRGPGDHGVHRTATSIFVLSGSVDMLDGQRQRSAAVTGYTQPFGGEPPEGPGTSP